MKKVLVFYGIPEDKRAFDKHYREVHIPLVRKMPHLKGFNCSNGAVVSSKGDNQYHLVAELVYDSQQDLDRSLESRQGIEAVEDVQTFASGGAEIVTIDVEKII